MLLINMPTTAKMTPMAPVTMKVTQHKAPMLIKTMTINYYIRRGYSNFYVTVKYTDICTYIHHLQILCIISIRLTVVKRQAETTTVSIPTSAPSCDDVQNNAAQACLYYTDPSQCSQCQFDRDTQCDGWTESVDNLQSAVDNRQWITDATDLYYLVLSVSHTCYSLRAISFVQDWLV